MAKEEDIVSPPSDGKELKKFAKEIIDLFKDAALDIIKKLDTSKKISYNEIFEYFIQYNKDPRIVKGILLKEAAMNHIVLYQVFLDKENNIVCNADQSPIGRKLKTKQLDDDLIELFGSNDLVIVE